MYYDRRVPNTLLDLLLPDRPLGWLVPWLSTDAAAKAGAHVQLRRDRSKRRNGAIQLYAGRTSPLEVRSRAKGRFGLHADDFYLSMAPDLFADDFDDGGLARASDTLRAHAEHAAASTHRELVEGEAVLHAGLMRRYGPFAPADTPFVALDSEVRMGFDSTADRVAFTSTLPALVGLPPTEVVPTELDLVAVSAGRLLLVEVKADATGLARAAWQAAVHVARFRALLAEHPGWFVEILRGFARAKARVGLLGQARPEWFEHEAVITPVIAAEDPRGDWCLAWRREIAPVVAASRGHLDGLLLWRLAADGRVVEEVAA